MRTKAEVNSSQWFGSLPGGWKMVPLSALFRFGKGLSITKSDLVSNGSAVISYGQIHSKENRSVEICESLFRAALGERQFRRSCASRGGGVGGRDGCAQGRRTREPTRGHPRLRSTASLQ